MRPVEAHELQAALETIDPQQREAVAAKAKNCEQPLFEMRIEGIFGSATPPSGTIKIKAGNYVSPAFTVSNKPIRLAVPMPPAGSPGYNSIEIIGQATAVRVSMTPSKNYPVVSGAITEPVIWVPPASCSAGQG